MQKAYSNTTATLTLAKASFRSILRSPSAVIFTLAFPLIFILVFGFLSNGGIRVRLGVDPGSDLQNPVIAAMQQTKVIKLIQDKTASELRESLEKGHIDALISVRRNTSGKPLFIADIRYTSASADKGNILRSLITNLMYKLNMHDVKPSVADVREQTVKGRMYRTIDFILPGQLGFSLLSTGVFGTAFVFFSLRQNLVIKRFFATPVKRSSIVIGEGIARIGFALLGALVIILIGHFFFHFTLIHGFITVINMLILCFLGVLVFMGFGFVVSGLARSESTIPPISNIITLPQFLLAGTFFSIEAFPEWLQPISRVLPLTYLNDAMRLVAFEGAGLWEVKTQILVLLVWGIAIYALAVRTFKWE
ncbi:ABC transporter permease [Pedobacter yulinensis]|uniref:Transport permease protein n=1 Tax=Pedobacter yulinensis TaxID=2126353 RepID=A0A2T3HJ28_9SPHI|nr:ABC transporter permease [Pedobacter yulinensis]PST82391.1 ABC transporter permease [Pedobacter yulinensis]